MTIFINIFSKAARIVTVCAVVLLAWTDLAAMNKKVKKSVPEETSSARSTSTSSEDTSSEESITIITISDDTSSDESKPMDVEKERLNNAPSVELVQGELIPTTDREVQLIDISGGINIVSSNNQCGNNIAVSAIVIDQEKDENRLALTKTDNNMKVVAAIPVTILQEELPAKGITNNLIKNPLKRDSGTHLSNAERPLKKPRLWKEEIVTPDCKNASDVFDNLISTQSLYSQQNLRSIELGNESWEMFKMADLDENLDHYQTFLKNIIKESKDKKTKTKKRKDSKNINELLETDINGFIQYLKKNRFSISNEIDAFNDNDDLASVIDRYNKLMNLLLLKKSSFDEQSCDVYMFTVANKFFEYCFAEETYEKFRKKLNNTDYFSILRLIYSVMQKHLTGRGWNNWSYECLNGLVTKSDEGKRIYYIAGGVDIYKLIEAGIYNITIIDPFLPSQEKFYLPHWEWFVKNTNSDNGIGDTLIFEDQKIILKRIKYHENGTFKATLSTGDDCTLPNSLTVWEVLDMENNNSCGTIEIERRFCNEKDFATDDKKSTLISFNELFYIITIKEDGGWGLDLTQLDENLELFVKQLQKPVNKQIMLNMNDSEGSKIRFKFCKLGSEPT